MSAVSPIGPDAYQPSPAEIQGILERRLTRGKPGPTPRQEQVAITRRLFDQIITAAWTLSIRGQHITAAGIGRWKARVQTSWVKRIHRNLKVEPICEPLEEQPLGLFRRASVIISCLDRQDHSSRLLLNQIATRAGVPWLDAGVSADGLRAYVQV